MKFRHVCILAASLAASSIAGASPLVGQILLSGYAQAVGSVGMGSATGLSFANGTGTAVSGNSGTISSDGGGSGSFAFTFCSTGACGTISDIASFATSAPIPSFLTFLLNGTTVTFDLGAITSVSHNTSSDLLIINATGVIHDAGFSDTNGAFNLSAQGDNIIAYSATLRAAVAVPTSVPEPASFALLGLGIAAIAVGRRKRTR